MSGRYKAKAAALKRALHSVSARKGPIRSPWWALPARMGAAVLWVLGMPFHLLGALLLGVSDELRLSVHQRRYNRAAFGGQKD